MYVMDVCLKSEGNSPARFFYIPSCFFLLVYFALGFLYVFIQNKTAFFTPEYQAGMALTFLSP